MSISHESPNSNLDSKLLEVKDEFQSQDWFSATLKSIGDAVIATSAEAEPKILFMNAVAEDLTGWTLDEAKGRCVLKTFNIINQKSRQRAVNPIERVIREGLTVGLENHTALISKSGQEFVIEDTAAPIRDRNGKITGVVLVFRDVTAKHVAEEKAKELNFEVQRAKQDLQDFFMQAPIPMVILLGPEHHFFLANEPYERLVGRKVTGRKLLDAFVEEEVAHFVPLLDGVYQTRKPYIGKELPLRIPDETGDIQHHYINLGLYPFVQADGQIKGILAFVLDVTEEVRTRKEIEQSKAAVENERENFRNLFRHSQEMVCVLQGPDHVFEFVNDAHIKILGFDATGQSVREAQPESVEVHRILDEVFQIGMTNLLQEIPVTVGDSLRFFNLTFAARRDKNGNVDGVMVLGAEVTDQVISRERLKADEAKFRQLANALPQIIWTATPDAFVDWYNDWWYAYLGLPRGTRWDDPDTFPMHPEDIAKTNVLWYEAVAAGRPFNMEQRFKRGSDGEYRWHLVRGVPIKDGNGRVISYVGANTDIHDQKMQEDELKATQARLSLAMQSAKISTWHINLGANAAAYSKETAAIFGLEHIEGDAFQLISSIMHPEDRERMAQTLKDSIMGNTDYFDEYRIVTATGETRWVRASGRIHEIGGRPFMSGITLDITEEKRRVEQVEEAKRTAEAANLAKTAFLANMSHEIRTPLGAIIGFSELLREPDLSPEERDQYLDTVVRSGQGLTRIIDDILDLAKVEAGRLDIEEIEVSVFDFMQEALDLFRDKAKQKGIYLLLNIEEDVPPHIISDPTRLRQILVNLIGNALKFTTKGGVRVNVKSAPQANGRVELLVSVKDTGIGLTASQKEKLFEPFVQADNSTTREYGGTGLGLVLSRRLANALGGNITIAECKEGQGCTFLLSFLGGVHEPVCTDEPEGKAESVPVLEVWVQNERLSSLKVLLADDSTDNQFLIARFLRKHGAAVEIANDGEEAIRKALHSEFDLILMDIQMPRVDGYEATRALRLNGYDKPIIALTAHAMAEERARTRAAGCTGHLTKPINQHELIDTIELLARRMRSQGIGESRTQ
ncbi:MAG TPA: PAS domain S-box protein [Oligoflexus sp.]|uniref:PAS domain S-box protein n=1 Tax=Oligoflexus sp. TaxID=1971216 RepID=UPI002D628AE3|nr:PAS domain S-box protein [Oligoflexus sp.]HYX38651.1 PAS domain S-box protein [Oligoflexus sp.]